MSKKKTEQYPIYDREQLYIKRDKEYISYNDPYACDGLTNGVWLVTVRPNSKSYRRRLSPKYAEIDGALEYLHEGLCNAMRKASELRPRSVRMSLKEQRAWKAYKKIMGKDIPIYFEYASYSDIADSACEHVKKILIENNCDINKIKEKYGIKVKPITNALDRMEV